MFRKALQKILPVVVCAGLVMPASLQAQSSDSLLRSRFPELANYLNVSEVLQAAVFDEVALTNQSPEAEIGKGLLLDAIVELAEAKYSHYHTSANHLAMLGPHRLFESRATPGLQAMVRSEFSEQEVQRLMEANGSIPPKAIAVLTRGREFADTLMEIYLDNSIYDKHTAVDEALAEYLSDDEMSVAAAPKSADLLSEHPYAYAFRVGFPQLSGMTWASQWMQLAMLEITLTAASDADLEAGMQGVADIYIDKIARAHGSMISFRR